MAAAKKTRGRSASRKALKPRAESVDKLQSALNRAHQLSMATESLPVWLQSEFSNLVAQSQANRLPHGLLIEGVSGIGKHIFAAHLCASLFCEQVSSGNQVSSCGKCSSCTRYLSGNHPDYLYVQPTEDEKTKKLSTFIRVKDIRLANEWTQLTGQASGRKVVLVDSADIMNRNAANGLLKTLEEPSGDTVLILLSSQPGNLPATIVSRCRRIRLRLQEQHSAEEWLGRQGVNDASAALRITGDAPFAAREVFSVENSEKRQRLFKVFSNITEGKASIARSIELLADLETHEILPLFMSWTTDILKCRAGAAQQCRNLDLVDDLAALGDRAETVGWLSVYDQLLELHRIDSASFKQQPVLESIFAAIRLQQKAL